MHELPRLIPVELLDVRQHARVAHLAPPVAFLAASTGSREDDLGKPILCIRRGAMAVNCPAPTFSRYCDSVLEKLLRETMSP